MLKVSFKFKISKLNYGKYLTPYQLYKALSHYLLIRVRDLLMELLIVFSLNY